MANEAIILWQVTYAAEKGTSPKTRLQTHGWKMATNCASSLIDLYNQVDFSVQSTWFHRLVNLFFLVSMPWRLHAFTRIPICCDSVCWGERKAGFTPFTLSSVISRAFTINVLYTNRCGETWLNGPFCEAAFPYFLSERSKLLTGFGMADRFLHPCTVAFVSHRSWLRACIWLRLPSHIVVWLMQTDLQRRSLCAKTSECLNSSRTKWTVKIGDVSQILSDGRRNGESLLRCFTLNNCMTGCCREGRRKSVKDEIRCMFHRNVFLFSLLTSWWKREAFKPILSIKDVKIEV